MEKEVAKELTDEEKKLSVTWVYPDGNLTYPIVLQTEDEG